MPSTVWPSWGVSKSLADDLGREFSQVLVILNPARGWQLYEVGENSSWTAERLGNAVTSYYENGHDGWAWWESPAAPRLFEDTLPRPPGDWLLGFLRERCLWRQGGARQFLKDLEEREKRRGDAMLRNRHERSLAAADLLANDARRQMPAGVSITDALKALRRRDKRAEIVA